MFELMIYKNSAQMKPLPCAACTVSHLCLPKGAFLHCPQADPLSIGKYDDHDVGIMVARKVFDSDEARNKINYNRGLGPVFAYPDKPKHWEG